MKNFLLIFTYSLFTWCDIAYAGDITPDSTKQLMMNMYNIISTLNPNKIEQFVNYYATKDAKFIYTITANASAPSTAPNQHQVKTFDLGKEEFITYLNNMVKDFVALSYDLKLESFEIEEDGMNAVATIHVVQIGKSRLPGTKFLGEYIDVFTKIDSSCNVSVSLAVSTPLISGMSCAETITLE